MKCAALEKPKVEELIALVERKFTVCRLFTKSVQRFFLDRCASVTTLLWERIGENLGD